MKSYLGDGVYAVYQEGEAIDGLLLSTDRLIEGVTVTHKIFLEGPVFENLITFVNQVRATYGAEPIIIPKER